MYNCELWTAQKREESEACGITLACAGLMTNSSGTPMRIVDLGVSKKSDVTLTAKIRLSVKSKPIGIVASLEALNKGRSTKFVSQARWHRNLEIGRCEKGVLQKKLDWEFQNCFKGKQRRTTGLQWKVRKRYSGIYSPPLHFEALVSHSSTEREKKEKHLHKNYSFSWVWRKQRSHRIQSFYLNNPRSVHIGVASNCSRKSQVQKFWPRHFVKNCSM